MQQDKMSPLSRNNGIDKYINTDISVISSKIQEDYQKYSLRGLTLSGGEPIHPFHTESIKQLITDIRHNIKIDIMAFSGYTSLEITQMGWVSQYIDLIIAGPYIDELKHDGGIVSSTNQGIMRFSNRFDDVSDNELINGERIIETHANTNGDVVITGLIGKHELIES